MGRMGRMDWVGLLVCIYVWCVMCVCMCVCNVCTVCNMCMYVYVCNVCMVCVVWNGMVLAMDEGMDRRGWIEGGGVV